MNRSKAVGLLLGPVIFLFLLNFQDSGGLQPDAWKVIALASWMIIWWITEAIPIPATALLPLVMLPLLNVFEIRDSTAPYASPIIFLFMGGFLIALGLEKHKLHTRIALNLIKLTGTHANGVILGFMIATAFLSMWISNTATTVMMLPIAMSVVQLLKNNDKKLEEHKSYKLFALGLLLSIAYAANIGGTATIIGTPPNVVLVGLIRDRYEFDLVFNRWLLIGIPVSISLLIITFLLITKVLFPNKLGVIAGSREIVNDQIKKLGILSRGEKLVTLVFSLTALSWIFRQVINDYILKQDLLNDTIIAMSGGLLMFIVPINLRKGKFLLKWTDTTKLPWGILLLFGGGLTLAKAMESTGIIQLIGHTISSYDGISIWILLGLLIAVMLFMTELMSNVALTTIFIPVVLGIADGLNLDPLQMAIPVTLASSCAFMMPISTPPNAIVFSSGYIRMKEMMKAGIVLNVVSIIILLIAGLTIIRLVY